MVRGLCWAGWIAWKLNSAALNMPWPAKSSHHPWSKCFKNLWPFCRGPATRGCVEIIAINHIVFLLWWKVWNGAPRGASEDVLRMANQRPDKERTRGRSFRGPGNEGSNEEGSRTQPTAAPPRIAPSVRIIIGRVIKVSVSRVAWVVPEFLGPHKDIMDKRKE